MKLNELVIGKTITDVRYLAYELVSIVFNDGTVLDIHQTSQTGTLELYYDEQEVIADDEEADHDR